MPAPQTNADHIAQMVALEPRLAEIIAEARAVDASDRRYCRDNAFMSIRNGPNFKQRLRTLVGTYAENRHPLLTSSAAWLLAIQTVYDSLPPCRDCYCNCPEDFEYAPEDSTRAGPSEQPPLQSRHRGTP